MREYEIIGSNIIITPKIYDENILNKIRNLSNVYLVVNDNSSTVICLFNNPYININGKIYDDKTQILEIIKTRNLLPKLINE